MRDGEKLLAGEIDLIANEYALDAGNLREDKKKSKCISCAPLFFRTGSKRHLGCLYYFLLDYKRGSSKDGPFFCALTMTSPVLKSASSLNILALMKEQRPPSYSQFEQRKAEHIALALDAKHQTPGESGLEQIQLRHEAFPELNFDEISIKAEVLGRSLETPFFVSSMTAGHANAAKMNTLLALACEHQGWAMGVGSQRRELTDEEEAKNWVNFRKSAPHAMLFSNIGLSQVIQYPPSAILKLAEALEAQALIVHCNPLQEALQPEGTPQFKGGYQALEALVKIAPLPIVVKETGCGFSLKTLTRLAEMGVSAVDVSGLGGTHWGRIEGARSPAKHRLARASKTFQNWGISTLDVLLAANSLKPKYEVWASGGIRSGLDAAKVLALGAKMVGYAKPILAAAVQGLDALIEEMKTYEYELKVALFCTGNKNLAELRESHVWHLKNK